MDYADETARVHIPLNALRHVISLREPLPARVRGIIVVNPTRVARSLIAVMQRLYPPFKQAFTYCNTLEEARALVQQTLAQTAAPHQHTSRR